MITTIKAIEAIEMKKEKESKDVAKQHLTAEDMRREIGRIVTDGYYGYQRMRTTTYNKIRALVHMRAENIDTSRPQEKKEEKDYSKKYSDKNIRGLISEMKKTNKFSEDESDNINDLLNIADNTKTAEKEYAKRIKTYVLTEPAYTRYLVHIKGIGPTFAANLFKNIGYCENFNHITSVWKYSGMHVVNGHAPKLTTGQKIDYNPHMRSLLFLIGDSFIKQRTPIYREIYDAEKKRQLELMKNETDNAPKSLKHADLRARRKMIKIFIAHYYVRARELKGIESDRLYQFDKLGHSMKHYIESPKLHDD